MDKKEVLTEEIKTEETTTEESTKKEEVTLDQIEDLTKIIHAESYKKEMSKQYEELQKNVSEMKSKIKGLDSEKDFIDEKLEKYTVEELEKILKKNDVVEDFFTDPSTGEPLDLTINFDSKEREIEFKRGYLVYVKSTQEAFKKIDEEYAKLDDATKEFNMEINEACYALSDNVLSYISMMTDKANAMEDEVAKKKILESLKYLKSGYDMTIFSEVLDQHPTVAKNCVRELTREVDIQRIGKRYGSKLKTFNAKSSLIPYTSDITSGRKSFEEMVLIRGDQYVIPDLFVFSLIRFFGMADWSDGNIRKAHASVGLTIKKLLANEFADDVKKDVIDSIVTYLAKFPTE